MSRHFRLPGDALETAVLARLWDLDTASVRELHELLGEPAGLVYTTTAKVVDRLREKRLIERHRRGKAYRYRARVTRAQIERERARSAIARLLGSAPQAVMAHLVEAVDSLDPGLLDELERAVAARRRSRHGT